MGWTCNRYGKMRNTFRILFGQPEGKGPLGRPRRRWDVMDIKETVCEGTKRIYLRVRPQVKRFSGQNKLKKYF
jgi:hypothetical protein